MTSHLTCIDDKQLREKIEALGKDNIIDADQLHVRVYDCTTKKLDLIQFYCKDNSENVLRNIPLFQNLDDTKGITGVSFQAVAPNRANETAGVRKLEDQKIQPNLAFKEFVSSIKNDSTIPPAIRDNGISILESFDTIIVEPLTLGSKKIGTLAAIRYKRQSAQSNMFFNEEDSLILKILADNIAIAIRSQWLAPWTDTIGIKKDGQYKQTVTELCEKVCHEARKRTLADDGKIRFIDWKGTTLVPGAVEKPFIDDSALLESGIQNKNKEMFCSLREKGVCPAGKAAETGVSKIYTDLQHDEDFISMKKHLASRILFFYIQWKHLEKWSKSDSADLNIDLNQIPTSLPDSIPVHQDLTIKFSIDETEMLREELKKELEKRRASINSTATPDLTKEAHIKLQTTHVQKMFSALTNYVPIIIEWNSEIVAPIKTGSHIIGVINVHSKQGSYFTESDLAILRSLADRVALDVIDQQQAVLNKIKAMGQDMTAEGSFTTLAAKMTDGIKEVAFFSDETEIYPLIYRCTDPAPPSEFIRKEGTLKSEFFEYLDLGNEKKAYTEEYVATYQALSEVPISIRGLGYETINYLSECNYTPTSGECTKKSVFNVRQYVDDPAQKGSPKVREKKVKTTACIPLVFRRTLYGLLYIHVTENHYFTEFEKDALTLFANQAAIVLKNIKSSGGDLYKNEYGEKLFLKCCVPLKEDVKVNSNAPINTIINILRRYEQRLPTCYKDEAVERIQEIVRSIVEGEGLPAYISETYEAFVKQENHLYLSPVYRDHFFHPFHAFLLGIVIFKEAIESQYKPFTINNDDDFIRQWIIAALWHDTSYASSKGPEWLRDFIEDHAKVIIKTSQDWSPLMQKTEILEAIESLCNIFTNNCNNQSKRMPFNRWINKQLLEFNDHGVFSAILLLMEYKKQGDNRNKYLIDQSALAIALHNFHKAYSDDSELQKKKLSENPDSKFTTPALDVGQLAINDYPLAFLLAFCDTAQEWGRPKRTGFSDKVHYAFDNIIVDPHKEDYPVSISLKVDISKDPNKDDVHKKLKEKNEQLFCAWAIDRVGFHIYHQVRF